MGPPLRLRTPAMTLSAERQREHTGQRKKDAAKAVGELVQSSSDRGGEGLRPRPHIPPWASWSTRVYSPRRLHRLPLLVRRLPLHPTASASFSARCSRCRSAERVIAGVGGAAGPSLQRQQRHFTPRAVVADRKTNLARVRARYASPH